MHASSALRLFALFAAGFIAAAVVMLLYGLLLGAIWPYVCQAEWPSLGANPSASIARARAFDACTGLASGALLARLLAAATKSSSPAPVACSLVGMSLYAYSSASDSTNMLSGLLESPLPTLLLAFAAVSAFVLRRRSTLLRGEA
jgi:hypothetical protein